LIDFNLWLTFYSFVVEVAFETALCLWSAISIIFSTFFAISVFAMFVLFKLCNRNVTNYSYYFIEHIGINMKILRNSSTLFYSTAY